jgi:NAD-dependent SIR2 family protein deacetylase
MDRVTTAAPPAANADLEEVADLISGGDVMVLSGAGISTESGIPDYRGPTGSQRPATPMTYQTFTGDPLARRRYWARSHIGWQSIAKANPNAGHAAVAAIEGAGLLSGIVTQNVDGLHLRAGSHRVVELHGTMRRVLCTQCGQVFDRRDLAVRVERDNPWIAVPENVPLGPDGDVLPETTDGFLVPECSVCSGMLKPDVVFFGEFIPAEKFREAEQLVSTSQALVVAGSSLVVNSGIRLVERARRRRLPVVIVNRGDTRADGRATVKVDAGTSDVLQALADALPGPR